MSKWLSFRGENSLVTGAGEGSIGVCIVQWSLSGGARVIATTSSYSKATKFLQHMFAKFGAKGSRLMVLPRNASSLQDTEALVKYVYSIPDDEWDLDHIIPFAAVDDISVVSCYGTSTIKNELNECSVIQSQTTQLKRTKGNPLLAVYQKHLTGHNKGAAAAWMLNGALQIMNTGSIPGNRNADNIDPALEEFDHIVFSNEAIQSSEDVKAVLVNAFGSGQKGAQAIVVHPKYLFSAAEKGVYETHKEKVEKRQAKADQQFVKAMMTMSMFRAKEGPPYEKEKEKEMEWLTNLGKRVPMDKKT